MIEIQLFCDFETLLRISDLPAHGSYLCARHRGMSGGLVSWSWDQDKFVLHQEGGKAVQLLEVDGSPDVPFTTKIVGKAVVGSGLTCMDYGERGLVWGSSTGAVNLVDWPRDQDKALEVSICPGSNQIPTTSVNWNPVQNSQVAAGFDIHKDFCVLIWDVEYASGNKMNLGKGMSSTTPLASVNRLCYEEAISSLCWMPEANPFVLIVGTATGWLRVFDTRIGSSGAETSLMAHTAARQMKGVAGLRPASFNSHSVASFSQTAGEPVKVWDLRKGSATKSKMALAYSVNPQLLEEAEGAVAGGMGAGEEGSKGGKGSKGSNADAIASNRIVDVAWSQSREDVLAVATTQQVQLYRTVAATTDTDMQTSTPFAIPYTTTRQIRSIDWKPRSNRLLVCSPGLVRHLRVIDTAALGFNDSLAVTASGPVLYAFQEPSTAPQGKTGEGEIASVECVETLMRERSSAGYSFDAGKNLQVLSEELDTLNMDTNGNVGTLNMSSRAAGGVDNDHKDQYGTGAASGGSVEAIGGSPVGPQQSSQAEANLLQLSRLWGWIDRVESLRDDDLTLTTCGVLPMFLAHSRKGPAEDAVNGAPVGTSEDGSSSGSIPAPPPTTPQPLRMEQHPVFNIPTYTSDYRDSARLVCGWSNAWTPPTPRGASGDNRNNNNPDEDEEYDDMELEAVVEECEDLDSFERAAALAVWHGHLELAVTVLNRNLVSGYHHHHTHHTHHTHNHHNHNNAEHDHHEHLKLSPEYTHLVSMVAMCFAGFPNNASSHAASGGSGGSGKQAGGHGGSSGHASVWVKMCTDLLLKLQGGGQSRRAAMYLAATCRFLLHVLQMQEGANSGTERGSAKGSSPRRVADSFQYITEDTHLYLEDRVAFATFFLPDQQVVTWVTRVSQNCRATGRLEGLILTGLRGDGIRILQEYVDRFHDIQSAALLVARELGKAPDMTNLNSGVSCEWMWLHEYRNLLNRWQLFVERAALDVELGNHQRDNPRPGEEEKASGAVATAGMGGSRGGVTPGGPRQGGIMGSKSASGGKRAMYALPAHNEFPHVFLRCHYCKANLPIDAMQQQQQTALLRKQKPIINFCPSCKKPLPRCYVCQLYMGFINPHAEVNRVLADKRRNAEKKRSTTSTTTMSSSNKSNNGNSNNSGGGELDSPKAEVQHNVLDYGRWLYFCQRCKHGGHASCIESWFEGDANYTKRSICGVNGCDCRCHG